MLYSFTASPNLSIDQVPWLAPFASMLNISFALNPAEANCTEYSLIVSSRSSFWFKPFCAPCAIKLKASSEDIPNLSIKELAVRTDSDTSMPNTSRNDKAFSVTPCKESLSMSPIICNIVDIDSPTSSIESPKLLLYASFITSLYFCICESDAPVAASNLFNACSPSVASSLNPSAALFRASFAKSAIISFVIVQPSPDACAESPAPSAASPKSSIAFAASSAADLAAESFD